MTVFLSESELAARLGVGKATVRRWRSAGELPHFRHGKVVRYRLEDVESFERDHFTDAVVVGLPRRRHAV